MLQWILGMFDFSQNEFEMRIAKKFNLGGTFKASYQICCSFDDFIKSIHCFIKPIVSIIETIHTLQT